MVEYDDNLLEPVTFYKNTLKQRVDEAANKHFDKLVKDANINVEENRETVRKYDDASRRLKEAQKKLATMKGLKTFLVVMIILTLLIGLTMTVMGAMYLMEMSIGLGVGIPLILVGIALIIVVCVVVNKKIKERQEIVNNFAKETEDLYALALSQINPLFSLYDYSTAYEIFDEAVDIINFDKFFDKSKLRYLVEKCDYVEDEDEAHSTLYVKSGEILGNPFILKRTKYQTMMDKQYTGSRTVTYTETYRDSDGHLRTRTVTETLYAHIYKPAPVYGSYTDLIYGNQAAPDLSFSRTPSGHNLADMKDKEKDKFLRKKEEELHKMAENSLKQGNYFTPLANTEFEATFNALNRDHEQQFRLLFTPLAQKNYKQLFESDEGFKDDFEFIKKKRTNFISSSHAQLQSLIIEPTTFISHSHDIAKSKFVDYVNSFFRGLYFDFAPLLSVPLYQQLKTLEYIYEVELESNNTMYEAEMVSNRFDETIFKNPLSATEAILKSHFVEKNGACDKVVVRAHSFEGQERVEIVMVRARNGVLYDVPVYWIEYLPIYQDNVVQVKKVDTTRPTYLNKMYGESKFSSYASSLGEHQYFDKLFAFKTNEYFSEKDDNNFNDMYNN